MAAVNLEALQAVPAEDIPLPLPGQLPVELLTMIFPDPAIIHGISPASANPRRQKWLAIKSLEPDSPFVTERVNPDETIATLRALSQVSRTFRAVAMPLLWSVCQVRTMKELGALRETLRINPSIAKLIRSFSWVWLMGGDYGKMNDYDKEEGSLLDLAFRNRRKMWDDLRKENKQKACTGAGGRVRSALWFNLENETGRTMSFEIPGWQSPDGEENEEFEAEWEGDDHDLFSWSYSRWEAVGGDGPDGYGEDRLIKSPAEFLDCLVEITAQLSGLETFAWGSPVSTMPVDVFTHLKKLTSLKSLQIVLHTARDNMHVVPYWELAKGLEHLSFEPRYGIHRSIMKGVVNCKEQDEKDLVSFTLPLEAPATKQAQVELNAAMACRTIIAAVRGGKLRRLHCAFPGYDMDEVFAVRGLLPYWVAIQELELESYSFGGAATSLRPLLAHASLCLDLANNERLLTPRNVQSLQAHFTNSHAIPQYRPIIHLGPQPIRLYLRWLWDDLPLAKQVADAWNTVVKTGGEDLVRCPCKSCKNKLRGIK